MVWCDFLEPLET